MAENFQPNIADETITDSNGDMVNVPVEETKTENIAPDSPFEVSDAVINSMKGNPPVQLEWKNLRYDVRVKGKFPWSRKKVKTVLHPMSGYVRPGEVLAILGPSGAGKTSLLNILAQRELRYTGFVKVNGKKLTSSFLNFSAYVEQDDVMHPNLTVYEVLKYAAHLRLSAKFTRDEKLTRVENIMILLGLEKCRDTRVGSPGGEKGISGGERKRLAIAIEILKGPSLLFLDEPTSGMDSKTSLNIVKAVRNLAKTGTTVVMTIHQPRSQIFDYFDQLLLLADGRVAFHGPATEVNAHFSKINPTYALPDGYNIADHVIDLITRTTGKDEAADLARKVDEKRIKGILDYWEKYHQELFPEYPPVENATDLSKYPNYSTAWYMQFFVLIMRNWNNLLKDRMTTIGKVVQSIFIVAFLSSLFFRLDNNQTNVQDRSGLLFFLMLSNVMNSLFSVLTLFPGEFKIFKREKAARAYSTSAYYLAKIVADLPYQMFFPFFSASIVYYIVGFNPLFTRYLTFIAILISTTLAGIGCGEVISAMSPKVELGLVLGPIIILAQSIFSGFYITRINIPPYYIWIYYISIFAYGFKALAVNEFTGSTYYCKPDQLVSGVCPITDGRRVLENLSIESPWYMAWVNVGILLAFTILFKVIGYIVLEIRTNTIRSTVTRYLKNKQISRKLQKDQDDIELKSNASPVPANEE